MSESGKASQHVKGTYFESYDIPTFGIVSIDLVRFIRGGDIANVSIKENDKPAFMFYKTTGLREARVAVDALLISLIQRENISIPYANKTDFIQEGKIAENFFVPHSLKDNSYRPSVEEVMARTQGYSLENSMDGYCLSD
jgi:hypothetical protein